MAICELLRLKCIYTLCKDPLVYADISQVSQKKKSLERRTTITTTTTTTTTTEIEAYDKSDDPMLDKSKIFFQIINNKTHLQT